MSASYKFIFACVSLIFLSTTVRFIVDCFVIYLCIVGIIGIYSLFYHYCVKKLLLSFGSIFVNFLGILECPFVIFYDLDTSLDWSLLFSLVL